MKKLLWATKATGAIFLGTALEANAASTATIVRIRQSMPDSEALNQVSGKIHSKELLRVRPIWTE